MDLEVPVVKEANTLYLAGPPRLVLTEWIPVGAHFVYDIQKRFGCRLMMHEDQGKQAQPSGYSTYASCFFITKEVDHEPNAAVIGVGDADVMLRVMEYDHMEYVRLEAKIAIEETGAAWQKEEVGIEISHDGRFSYGIELDDRYSLDSTARIVADLVEDTSRVMDTILNAYQKRLLNAVFFGESRHRDKFITILAREVPASNGTPCSMGDLLGSEVYRAQLCQVLGTLNDHCCVTFDTNAYLIFGEQGLLLVAEDEAGVMSVLQALSLMECMTAFLNNVFSRVAWLWDCLAEQEHRIKSGAIDEILDIQIQLSDLSEQQGLLSTVGNHMRRDRQDILNWMEQAAVGKTAADRGITVFTFLERLFVNLQDRATYTQQSIESLGREIENIRTLATALVDRETAGISRAMNMLTLVSIMILPLTLITGVYGMNFSAYRPEGQLVRPLNMPELYCRYGYVAVLLIMATIIIIELFLFKRLQLFGRRTGKRRRPSRLVATLSDACGFARRLVRRREPEG